jgi:drug/metabolite transporter (DMT)-like permease
MAAPSKDIDVRGAAAALLVSLLWGANPVIIKIGLVDAPPLRLAWMRMVVGGVVVALWGWRTGRFAAFSLTPAEWRPLIVIGVLFTAQVGLMNIGTALTTAAHSTILLNLYAVHTVVLAHFMIPGDRFTLRRGAGIVIAYAGIVGLFAGELGHGEATLLGDAIVFVSAFLLAERTVYLARYVQHLDPLKLLLSQAIVGTALFLVASQLFEDAPTHLTWRLAAVVAYQGIVVAGFNFVVNLWLLKHYRASALVAFFLTQPVFGVAAAALLVGETLSPVLLLASIAVAIGIGLTSR